MKSKQDVIAIVEALKALYPDGICSLEYQKDYELLFATRLAAQCTDERVNQVTPILYGRFPTLEALANADVAEVEEIVHSTGFFPGQGPGHRGLRPGAGGAVRRQGTRHHGGAGGSPRVGRKTANLILGDVHHVPGVVVADTHCIRISGLLGLTDGSKDPAKVEQQLRKILPPEESNDFCHRLVLHGRAVCVARRPDCANCVLARGATTSTALMDKKNNCRGWIWKPQTL